LSSVAASWASGAIGREAATHPVPGEFVGGDTRQREWRCPCVAPDGQDSIERIGLTLARAFSRLPASEQSEAERYDKAFGSIMLHKCRSSAGRRLPCLAADVRPPLAERAVFADLWRSPRLRGAGVINNARRRHDGARNGAKRA